MITVACLHPRRRRQNKGKISRTKKVEIIQHPYSGFYRGQCGTDSHHQPKLGCRIQRCNRKRIWPTLDGGSSRWSSQFRLGLFVDVINPPPSLPLSAQRRQVEAHGHRQATRHSLHSLAQHCTTRLKTPKPSLAKAKQEFRNAFAFAVNRPSRCSTTDARPGGGQITQHKQLPSRLRYRGG